MCQIRQAMPSQSTSCLTQVKTCGAAKKVPTGTGQQSGTLLYPPTEQTSLCSGYKNPMGLKYGWLPISDNIPEVGDRVYHIGHPNLTPKKLSRYHPDHPKDGGNVHYSTDKDIKYYASATHGNSGSPIIHEGKVVGLMYGGSGSSAIGHTFRSAALYQAIEDKVEESIARYSTFDLTDEESVTVSKFLPLPITLQAAATRGTSLRLKNSDSKFELVGVSGGWWIRWLYAGFNPVYELRLKTGETLTESQHAVPVIHSPGVLRTRRNREDRIH